MRTVWTVYLLRCGDGSLYTGCTNDLDRRVRAHREGRASKYTASRRPVELAWSEAAPDRAAAQRREAEIKRMGKEEKEELIERGSEL